MDPAPGDMLQRAYARGPSLTEGFFWRSGEPCGGPAGHVYPLHGYVSSSAHRAWPTIGHRARFASTPVRGEPPRARSDRGPPPCSWHGARFGREPLMSRANPDTRSVIEPEVLLASCDRDPEVLVRLI